MATTRASKPAVSRRRRAAYGEIEADARRRIRALRTDASAELAALRRGHRDVARDWATSRVKRPKKALPR